MKIRGLGYIGFNAPDLSAWRGFAEDLLGFMPAEGSPSPAGGPLRPGRAGSLFYRIDERSWRIAVHEGDAAGLAYLGWELADRDALAAAADHLSRCGIEIDRSVSPTTRGVSDLIRFVDPEGISHELFYEKFYFTPGDLGFRAWQTRHAKIGVCVCWDQWYPESARLTALAGAQILFFPTAIGWHPGEKAQFGARQHDAWETIQRSHAIANGCYVAVPNRVGHEAPDGGDGIEFWGQSFVVDPAGQIVAKASVGDEEILLVEADLDALDTQRTHWPFFRDRRIDAYGEMTKRFID